jgi:hypothetical protein
LSAPEKPLQCRTNQTYLSRKPLIENLAHTLVQNIHFKAITEKKTSSNLLGKKSIHLRFPFDLLMAAAKRRREQTRKTLTQSFPSRFLLSGMAKTIQLCLFNSFFSLEKIKLIFMFHTEKE